jgi:hypothetical protein
MTPGPAILCSGVALGVYVPGLLVRRDLERRGLRAEVFVLEELFTMEKREALERSRVALHQSHRMAVAAHKLARDVTPSLDAQARAALMARWMAERRDAFIVLSGFWLPLLEDYEAQVPFPVRVELLHLDSVDAPSFRIHAERAGRHTRRRIFDLHSARIEATLWSSREAPLPFTERRPRLMCHGGGWGMGTYAAHARALAEQGLGVDLVTYPGDVVHPDELDLRVFRVDPAWTPWSRDGEGRHTMPPFNALGANAKVSWTDSGEQHGSFELARRNVAMVSKPGGGTLLDSFSAATPLVLLEGIGEHEESNAQLWESLGFGIRYEKWAATGHAMDVLHDLHQNLLRARAGVADLSAAMARELTA